MVSLDYFKCKTTKSSISISWWIFFFIQFLCFFVQLLNQNIYHLANFNVRFFIFNTFIPCYFVVVWNLNTNIFLLIHENYIFKVICSWICMYIFIIWYICNIGLFPSLWILEHWSILTYSLLWPSSTLFSNYSWGIS